MRLPGYQRLGDTERSVVKTKPTQPAKKEEARPPPGFGVNQIVEGFRQLGLRAAQGFSPNSLHEQAVNELRAWGLSSEAAKRLADQPGYPLAHAQLFGGQQPLVAVDIVERTDPASASTRKPVFHPPGWLLDKAERRVLALVCDAWLKAAPLPLAAQLLSAALPSMPLSARELLCTHVQRLLTLSADPQQCAQAGDLKPIAHAICSLAELNWTASKGPNAVPAAARAGLTTVADNLHPLTGVRVQLQNLDLALLGQEPLSPQQAGEFMDQLETRWASALALDEPERLPLRAVRLAEAVAQRCPSDADTLQRCTAMSAKNQQLRLLRCVDALRPWGQLWLDWDRSGRATARLQVDGDHECLKDPKTRERALRQFRECLRALCDGRLSVDWAALQAIHDAAAHAAPAVKWVDTDLWVELANNHALGPHRDAAPLTQLLGTATEGSVSRRQLERAQRRLAQLAPPQRAELLRHLVRLLPKPDSHATQSLHQRCLKQLAQLAVSAPERSREIWRLYVQQNPLSPERSAQWLVPLVLDALNAEGIDDTARKALAEQLGRWLPAVVQPPTGGAQRLKDTEVQFELLRAAMRCLRSKVRRLLVLKELEHDCRQALAAREKVHRAQAPLELSFLRGAALALQDRYSGTETPIDKTRSFGLQDTEFFRDWCTVLSLRASGKTADAVQADQVHRALHQWYRLLCVSIDANFAEELMPVAEACFAGLKAPPTPKDRTMWGEDD